MKKNQISQIKKNKIVIDKHSDLSNTRKVDIINKLNAN
jgi:hypothetical protein